MHQYIPPNPYPALDLTTRPHNARPTDPTYYKVLYMVMPPPGYRPEEGPGRHCYSKEPNSLGIIFASTQLDHQC